MTLRAPPDRGYGPGAALFAILLLGGGVFGLLGVVGSVVLMVRDRQVLDELVAAGIVEEGVEVQVWHPHEGEHSGCIVVAGELTRWDGGVQTASAPLRGAQIDRVGEHLMVVGPKQSVACPVGRGVDADLFEEVLREVALTPADDTPPSEPTDPRLRRALGLDNTTEQPPVPQPDP